MAATMSGAVANFLGVCPFWNSHQLISRRAFRIEWCRISYHVWIVWIGPLIQKNFSDLQVGVVACNMQRSPPFLEK